MANGDAAAAAGYDLVAATDDKRLGYSEINKSRDYLANHVTSGGHPATTVISTGQLPIAKGGTGAADAAAARTALGIAAANIPNVNGTVQGDLAFLAATKSDVAPVSSIYDGNLNPAIWSRPLNSSYRALYIRNDGVIGLSTSSRRFKQNIEAERIPLDVLRAIVVKSFRYRTAVRADPNAARHLGAIAEELADLGLDWVVDFDEKGLPFDIAVEKIGWLALQLAQYAYDDLDALSDRVTRLEQERD